MRWQARVGDTVRSVELARRRDGQVEATVDGRRYALSISEPQSLVYSILADGVSHEAIVQRRQGRFRVRLGRAVFDVVPEEPGRAGRRAGADGSGQAVISAVMPGRVLRVMVSPGQKVAAREGLVVIEAMKMENELTSPRDGTVRQVKAAPGATVETGDVLVVIE